MEGTVKAVLVGLRPYKFKDRQTGEVKQGSTGVFLSTDGTGETVELGLPSEQESELAAELEAAPTKQLPVVVRLKFGQSREQIGDSGRFRKVARLRALEVCLV